jgi:5-(carboxyamino)imidazole ribonucleotide mutase
MVEKTLGSSADESSAAGGSAADESSAAGGSSAAAESAAAELSFTQASVTAEGTPLVGIIIGSKSDLEVIQGACEQLADFKVPYELVVASAHRNPEKVHAWSASAVQRGFKVIIAAAGKAAHLAGVVAAFTPLPVIAVPIKTSDLGGLDSLLSMVQMPTGVPVACVAINGARNAAILATQIIGTGDLNYQKTISDYKHQLANQ